MLALIQNNCTFIKRGNLDSETCVEGKPHEETEEALSYLQAKEGGLELILSSQPSEGTNTAATLIHPAFRIARYQISAV